MNNFNLLPARLISLWFLGVTCLMVIGGSIWLAYNLWFVAHASKTTGHIVAMQPSHGPHGDIEYSPVFSFNDASGIVHTQKCSMSSSEYSFEVGENVTILYDPARPLHSKIDSFGTLWFGPLFVIGASLISGSFIAVIVYAFSRIRQNQP